MIYHKKVVTYYVLAVLLNIFVTDQSVFAMEHPKKVQLIPTTPIRSTLTNGMTNAIKKTSQFLKDEALLVLATICPGVNGFSMDNNTNNTPYHYDYTNSPAYHAQMRQIGYTACGTVGAALLFGAVWYVYYKYQTYVFYEGVENSLSEETDNDTDNEDI